MERNKIAKLASKLIIELIKTDLPNKEINRLNDIVADIRDEAINYTRCCKSDSELLVCLDNGNYEMLTNYKLYTLVSESKGYYNLYDDDGQLVQMSKVRFKKVVAN